MSKALGYNVLTAGNRGAQPASLSPDGLVRVCYIVGDVFRKPCGLI